MMSRRFFDPNPKARASLRPGTMYAVDGGDGFLFFGQVDSFGAIGFLRCRAVIIPDPGVLLSHEIMTRIVVARPSVGRALRRGLWGRLGRYDIHPDLVENVLRVQWPAGTVHVSVWNEHNVVRQTTAFDSAIQDFEIIVTYDAEHHVAERLRFDYAPNPSEWHVGGPIRRERRMREELARRFGAPGHQLPDGWVFLDDSNTA